MQSIRGGKVDRPIDRCPGRYLVRSAGRGLGEPGPGPGPLGRRRTAVVVVSKREFNAAAERSFSSLTDCSWSLSMTTSS